MPGRIISLVNFKGGVGKTTLTVNLAACLAKEHDKKVLLVDLDPQSNSSIWLLGPQRWSDLNAERSFRRTAAELFYTGWTEDIFIRPFIDMAGAYLPNLYLCPASLQMMKLEEAILRFCLHRRMDGSYRDGDEYFLLARGARLLRDGFDYVFIDCPPNLYFGTCNALCHSDYLLLPSIPDTLSTIGLQQLIEQMGMTITPLRASGRLTQVPKIIGVAITRFEAAVIDQREGLNIIEQVISDFRNSGHLLVDGRTRVFVDQPMKKHVVNSAAVQDGRPLCFYAPGTSAYNDVKAFTQAFLSAIEEGQ